jgi:acetolactate synthase I/II/III large subunit
MTQAVSAPPRTGAEALADAIAAEGTEVVFGVLGDGNLHWVPQLVARHGARYVAARHEAAAVAMADGYARATGCPGVCTVTQGPGLTQTGTTLTEARRARTPLVLVAGDTLRGFHDHAQDIAQEPFALATAGAYRGVGHAGTLGKDVAEAFRHARLGHGPIVLSVPLDAQTAPVADDAPAYVPSTRGLAPAQRAAPDPERVAAVAAMLAEAKRPVVLAGRGAVAAGARAEVLEIAERIGAVLVTSLQAKGWFRGEAFDLGIAGGFSHDLCRDVLGEADLVLAVGAHLNRFTVAHGSLFPRARVVHVDRDPDAIGTPRRWTTPSSPTRAARRGRCCMRCPPAHGPACAPTRCASGSRRSTRGRGSSSQRRATGRIRARSRSPATSCCRAAGSCSWAPATTTGCPRCTSASTTRST